MRYVLSGMRRQSDVERGLYVAGANVYVSRNGCTTYNAEHAAVWRKLTEAEAELEYWQRMAPVWRWTIEQLPRGPVAAAVLRAKPAEAQSA